MANDVFVNDREISCKAADGKSIAAFCKLGYHAVMRRLPEMERMGQVKVVGRCASQKFRPLLWELTDKYKIEDV